MVLVQAYPRREGKVGTQAYKHPTPVLVVQIEIVLVDPALLEFQVRAVILLSADRHQDPGGFSGLEDHGHSIGGAISQILLYEVIASLFFGRFHDRSTPFLGSVLQPVLELIGDFRQGLPRYPFPFTIGIKEPEHALGLLERLDQTVQQDSIEASIPELDAMLMMLVEGVHGALLCGEIPGAYRCERLREQHFLSQSNGISRAQPLAS